MSSLTSCWPSPMPARTTGICSCPSRCLPSTTRPRSILSNWPTPFFIDRGAQQPAALGAARPSGGSGSDSPAHNVMRIRELELMVGELLAEAQQERKAKRDVGRINTVFKVEDQVLPRTTSARLRASCARGGMGRLQSLPALAPRPTRSRCRRGCGAARRSTWTGSSPSMRGQSPTCSRPSVGWGAEWRARGGDAAQLQND